MKRWLNLGYLAVLLFSMTACESLGELDELEVINENQPDRERVLATAGDIESLVTSGFFLWHQGTLDYYGPAMALSATADETSISWGNAAIRDMSSEPRKAYNNSPSYGYAYANERPWYKSYEALSAVYDAFKAIETDESGTVCEEIDCDRVNAFGKFLQGLAHGTLALHFDSAFVFDETVDLEAVSLGEQELPLLPYPDVMDAALGYLDAAIAASTGANWSLPAPWIRGNGYSAADFVRVINAFYVRFLTQVNRTQAERDQVDWGTVVQRVNAGLTPGMGGLEGTTGDVWLDGDAAQDWFYALQYYGAQSTNTTWQRADYKTIGWTDQSGGYTNWLATPVANRQEFVMLAQDARIHPHGNGLGVGTDFQYFGSSAFPASRGTYHYSMYQHYRYSDYADGDQSAPVPLILYEEQQLMKAEGLYRTGDRAGAAAIVNNTRVTRGDMQPAAAGDSDLYDKIIYEYLIENFLACEGCAYFNRRGWGPLAPTGPNHHWGLVEGSPRHFPMPGQELEILEKLNYTYGGVGTEGGPLAPAVAVKPRTVPARMVYAFNGLATIRDKLDYIYGERDGGLNSGVRQLIRH